MIESPARITRVEGSTAWVVSEAPSSCGACGGKGCGSSLFARLANPREPEFRVDNPIAAQAGEHVVLGVPEGTLLRAALVSYIAPLVLLIGGAGMGQYLGGEPVSALGGLSGLILAAIWLAGYGRSMRTPQVGPVILRRGATACSTHQ
jgi:sigma-E factor negative regulatory protein RseC